ncbi:MAG: MBL fold metallo-hydrolase [bacterium]
MSNGPIRLSEHLYIYKGSINTGILFDENRVLIIDIGDGSVLPNLDEKELEYIIFTHHHRDQAEGIAKLSKAGTKIGVSERERKWFEEPEKFWKDRSYRWHIYNLHPHTLMLTEPVKITNTYKEGDIIRWGNANISILETPGHTDGSLSYVVEVDNSKFIFSGDVIYDKGQIWELYSMQKGETTTDYHGFLGSRKELKQSLYKLKENKPDALIPSHGNIIYEPDSAIELLIDRLDKCYNKYVAISALRYYFPEMFKEFNGRPGHLQMREGKPVPQCLRHYGTSWIIISESKSAFVIDCGNSNIVNYLLELQEKKEIANIDGLWITHYHDDHVDGIPSFLNVFGCPIYADGSVADVLENPRGFRIPCISPVCCTVRRTSDGESWCWEEFNMTAYHFPGQTYYHGGLLVEGRGLKMFFAGDSFTMSGIDDYCASNRNWLGDDVGFDRCLRIIDDIKPTHIFNCHVDCAFDFTDKEIKHMRKNLAERIKFYGELFPYDSPNYGMDEHWVRCCPYEQDVIANGIAEMRVCIMNHSDSDKLATCRPILPKSWNMKIEARSALIPAKSEGYIYFSFMVPENIVPDLYVIPIEISYDGKPLGQFREAILTVIDN